jgi:hypothetical protein
MAPTLGFALDEMVLQRAREQLVSLVSGCFFAKNAPCILYGERYALGDTSKSPFLVAPGIAGLISRIQIQRGQKLRKPALSLTK